MEILSYKLINPMTKITDVYKRQVPTGSFEVIRPQKAFRPHSERYRLYSDTYESVIDSRHKNNKLYYISKPS